jgi:putative ABC transport system substrate-binding protein
MATRGWGPDYLPPPLPDDCGRPSPLAGFLKAFLEELRVLGYVQGQNFLFEYRTAEGRLEALPALARELTRLKPDVIVAPTTPVARAAKAATTSIPVVFTVVSDPVGSGLVVSLSHPGGNVTGMTDMGVDLVGKQLDLLKQLVPNLKRVGAVGNPADKVWDGVWREARQAAHSLRIEIMPVLVNTPSEMEAAFADLNRRVEALLVAPQLFFSLHRQKLIELESLSRLPATHELRAFPEAGSLMSYGPSYAALFRKAAHHVDRILKGAKPADLPVEQPTEYELVINLRTAKSLGLMIPQPILARADDLIR